MHINGLGFLKNMSRHIMFATGSMIKNRIIENVADGIMQVHKLYLESGFKITHMHTDCEFESLQKEMTALGINLNYESKKEYVPEIKHFIWTVKERVRSTRATMPFKRISKLMIVYLVSSTIFSSMYLPHQHLAQDFQIKDFPENFYLELCLNKKRFAASIQVNMSR